MNASSPAPPLVFEQFGRDHLVAIAAVLLAAGVLGGVVRALRDRPRAAPAVRAIGALQLTVMLLAWLAGTVHEIHAGRWTLQDSLPLHLCDIGLIVSAVAVWQAARIYPGRLGRGGQFLFELAYFWGLGGTLQAVLTPDVIEPFPAFMSIRFFVTHGGIIVGVLILVLGLGYRPLPGSVWRVWIATFVLALLVMAVNGLLGANYMFLCGPPKRPSLMDYFGPWPWSLLTLVVVGTVFFLLWYSPFWIVDRVRGAGTTRTAATRSGPNER